VIDDNIRRDKEAAAESHRACTTRDRPCTYDRVYHRVPAGEGRVPLRAWKASVSGPRSPICAGAKPFDWAAKATAPLGWHGAGHPQLFAT